MAMGNRCMAGLLLLEANHKLANVSN